MKPRIQVAFQGGGARVMHLLAAVETLQSFEKQRFMEITRVAGTSAGSIAATVLSADVDAAAFAKSLIGRLETTLQTLRNSDPIRLDILENFDPPKLGWVPSRIVNFVWRHAKPQAKEILETKYPDLIRILGGQALYRSAVLREELRHLIHDCRRNSTNPECKGLVVLTSNLRGARAQSFFFDRFAERNEDAIYEAVIHSCAIPFVFRTPHDLDTTALVDGGLCENLPCDVLNEDESTSGKPEQIIEKYGQIMAIGFKQEKGFEIRKDIQSYLMSLFDTAINNSMLRAKARLKPDAISEIQPSLGTLDFAQMISHGPGSDSYQRIKYETRDWLERYLHGVASTDKVIYNIPVNTQPLAAEITRKIATIAEAQRKLDEYEVESHRMVIIGHSLEVGASNDLVKVELECVLKSDRLYCMEVFFEGGEGVSMDLSPIRVEVVKPNGTDVPIVVLTGRTSKPLEGSFGWRQVGLIFFTPPLQQEPGQDPRFFVRTDQRVVALDMAPKEGWDVALLESDKKAFNRTEIVVFLPPAAGKWNASCLSQFEESQGVEGRIMERGDVARNYHTYNPGGWEGYGLTTGRVEVGQAAILQISRSR
jgi:predicted acylesterase/phospholipase RssA